MRAKVAVEGEGEGNVMSVQACVRVRGREREGGRVWEGGGEERE